MNPKPSWSRRAFVTSAMALVAAPALRTGAWADAPLMLRCSLETAPSHARNVVVRDYLGKIETAAGRQDQDAAVRERAIVSRSAGRQGAAAGADRDGGTGKLVPDRHRARRGFLSTSRALRATDRDGAPCRRWQVGAAARDTDRSGGSIAHVIGPWLDLGFFNWYSTNKPLNSYGDLKGLKIRNSGGAGQAWRTQFMGAIPNTTPLPNVPLGPVARHVRRADHDL